MNKPNYYLPDGSPVYDKKKASDFLGSDLPGCVLPILSLIGIILLFVIVNLFLKWIGAGFYVIPFPRF